MKLRGEKKYPCFVLVEMDFSFTDATLCLQGEISQLKRRHAATEEKLFL